MVVSEVKLQVGTEERTQNQRKQSDNGGISVFLILCS